MQKEDCDICYKIICKECGWEADSAAVLLIQQRKLTACPRCGWKPGEDISDNEKRKLIRKFLHEHHLAVVSTYATQKKSPESALVAFVEDDELCLYFQTGKYTRKAENLRQNPALSVVIGLSVDEQATMQYEGKATLLESAKEIKKCKMRFLVKKSPTTSEHLNRPEAVLYKLTPTWIGFSDYKSKSRPLVFTLEDF